MPWLALDPVLGHAAAAAVSIVLIVGAWHKFADLDAFGFSVERYGLLPASGARAVSLVLPPLEALAGALLLAPPTRGAGALLAAALVAFVTAAVVVNLLRGRTDIDCGCGAAGHRQRLSWALVVRNAVLLLACFAAAAPEAPRTLVWLDAFTAVFAALAFWAVHAGSTELFSDMKRFASGTRSAPAESAPHASPRTGS